MITQAMVERAVRLALEEDAPWGDLTTWAFVPRGLAACMVFRFREAGVVCGLPVAAEVFRQAAPGARFQARAEEGVRIGAGEVAAVVEGLAHGLLLGERLALNFLQRLSGIATLTARYVEAARAASPTVRIASTRKTTPGLRGLEKYAVVTAGGNAHRFSLSDGVLVKDNHLALLAKAGVSLDRAVERARTQLPHGMKLQVEVESLDQARLSLDAGVELLLLDNMELDEMARVVALARGRAITEASGRITLERVAAVAACGVDIISVGALTHSAPAMDIGLDIAA